MSTQGHRAPIDPVDRSDYTLDTDPELPEAPVEIPVRVTGPVRTQDIGVDMAASTQYTVDASAPVTILGAQDTRAYADVISATQDIYIGPVKAVVAAGTAGVWPAGLPFRTAGRTPLYARTTSGSSIVSVFNYQVG